ncbi:hypothetical protein FRC09_007008, partial [Ceratobasidium sp. 395]
MRLDWGLLSSALQFSLETTSTVNHTQSLNEWSRYLANGGNAWEGAFKKARDIVAKMTVEEKVNLTTGLGAHTPCGGNTGEIPRFGIPSFCLQDGPTGVRPADFASQFPSQVTVAATWDRDLFYQRAYAIGSEFRDKGVHVALAPVTGGPLGRSPLGGRNWEGFSADPYLSSVGSYLSVVGFQDAGVVATSKHYILYEQETQRNQYRPFPEYNVTHHPLPISSDLGDAAFHETYLLSFAEAVRAGTGSIMCSYNRINGSYGCENPDSLNRILKGELNYQGYVMSDWFAQWTNESAPLNGLDMTMPGTGFWGPKLVELVESGDIPMARLDDMAHRILTPYYALGQDTGFPPLSFNTGGIHNKDYVSTIRGNKNVNVQRDHYKLIRKIGEESTTLLKNVRSGGGGLPLQRPQFLAVFGQDAGPNPGGLLVCGPTNLCPGGSTNNGTNSVGGGSGATFPPYIVTPLEAIQARARQDGTQVNWLLDDHDLETAATNALIADTSIVFTHAYQTEGNDRDNLTLWSNGDELIKTVASQCNNTVVVIHSMEDWIEHPNVTAVLFAYYPGQETGNAITSILYGHTNPSGKLPFTLARSEDDYPTNGIFNENVTDPHISFDEGNLVDYKWFDAKKIRPRFEFGFGLSYTTFSYRKLEIRHTPGRPLDGIHRTNEPFDGEGALYDVAWTVTADITNTGSVDGCEVVQLYLSCPEDQTSQPARSLRGFDKLCLSNGETKSAVFKLRQKDIAVWDVVRQTWTLPK